MIPHSSAGQPWGHPMRTLNGGPGRVDLAQMAGHYDSPSVASQQSISHMQSQSQSQSQSQLQLQPPPPLQPPIRQTPVIDLTASGSESQDREPPPKRPRLDLPSGSNMGDASSTIHSASAEPRSTPGGAGSRPQPSWRGRPLWSFQAVMAEIPGNENRGDGATGSKPPSPPPFPAQPWTHALPDRQRNTNSTSCDVSPVKKVSTTPYRIETPSAAPILKGDKVAGFAPWTGNHPEDVLNEQTAKQGYYDRTQVSQNESNTARPALYTQLKHRTGLQMLSSVFTAALEKRQNHNAVHAPSTFKPPPRVTLTDNKREAWLRDLANSAVPLRRLSRTIPHGIRGKLLLDQCLGKWIPVARAVWLAKCVGANEIRAFKRKGTSGALAVGLEAKWVREWTTNVQQFVEGVFNAPKGNDWKAKMSYAVGLAARLFFENLLDHDHFLEWFLSSFEAASLATVPVWLLMLGIYWNNLLRYRRRGRRLAEVLLEKFRQATAAKVDALLPLVDRLSRFIRKLILEHTSSMILPYSWNKYQDQVQSCLNLSDKLDRALFQSLAERNVRVQRPRNSKQSAQQSPQQRLIRLFDSIRSAHDIITVSSACIDAVDDRAVLVSKLLQWLATPFRYGICRVYVGVRLLRKWKTSGIDVDEHILSFLTQGGVNSQLNMDNVYHAISELVRSQTFSVGRYLQWLMAKGVTNRQTTPSHSDVEQPTDIVLLTQLPIGRLPDHIGNLRNTLMARTGFSVVDEDDMVTNVKVWISHRLPTLFSSTMSLDSSMDSLPVDLTWAVKAEIAQWIRRGVAEHVRAASTPLRVMLPSEAGQSISALTPEEFYKVRDVLEKLADISMLADVLKIASSSDDSIVLASVADTTNCHFDSLSVIGAMTELFRGLVDAYAGIKRFGTPSLDLMFSLIELGLRIPSELNTVAILRQDLSRMENKSVVAACSPVSDHIPDSLGEADPLLREKLDQILLLGNVIDEPTLDAIFNTLVKHLESGEVKTNLSANDACRYLAQLRSFQPKYFDVILFRWVCGHLRSSNRSTLLRILPALIGVGCVTIQSFLSLAKKLSSSAHSIPNVAELPLDLVQLLVSSRDGVESLDLVSYRFQLARQEFVARNTEESLRIACDAAICLNSGDQKPALKHINLESGIVTLLRELLVRNPECTSQYCLQRSGSQFSAAAAILKKALDLLLMVHSQEQNQSPMSEVELLAKTTDDFSLPLCQLKFQVLFHTDSANEDRTHIVDAMFKTVVADSRANKLHWVDLVALMSPDAVRQIRERAEKEFLAIPLLEEPTTSQSIATLEPVKLYITIIEQLASSIPESGVPAIAPVLVEKMESLLHKVVALRSSPNNVGESRSTTSADQGRATLEQSLAFWFSALLRMVVIHRASFIQPSPAVKVGPAPEQSRLLISIFCIALSRLPEGVLRVFPGADYFPRQNLADDYRPCPGILLQTHALDVAASLMDILPDDVRHQCARFLKEKFPPFATLQNDPRFIYLLGPMSDTNASSVLQATSAPSPAASSSTPQSVTTNLPNAGASSQLTISSLYSGASENSNSMANRLRIQSRGRIIGPYPIRPWELLEDSAPFVGVNDTAVNLGYFDARRVRA